MSAFSVHAAVLFAHIVGGTLLVGSSLFMPTARRALRAADRMGALRVWLDFARHAARLDLVAAIVVLGTGIYLGSAGWWSQPWFFATLGAWVVNSLLVKLVIARSGTALGRLATGADDEPVTPAIDALRRSRSWATADEILRANNLAILFLMLDKPGLVTACAVVLGGMALAVALPRARQLAVGRAEEAKERWRRGVNQVTSVVLVGFGLYLVWAA